MLTVHTPFLAVHESMNGRLASLPPTVCRVGYSRALDWIRYHPPIKDWLALYCPRPPPAAESAGPGWLSVLAYSSIWLAADYGRSVRVFENVGVGWPALSFTHWTDWHARIQMGGWTFESAGHIVSVARYQIAHGRCQWPPTHPSIHSKVPVYTQRWTRYKPHPILNMVWSSWMLESAELDQAPLDWLAANQSHMAAAAAAGNGRPLSCVYLVSHHYLPHC